MSVGGTLEVHYMATVLQQQQQQLTIEGEYATLPFPPPVSETGSDHTEHAHLAGFTGD